MDRTGNPRGNFKKIEENLVALNLQSHNSRSFTSILSSHHRKFNHFVFFGDRLRPELLSKSWILSRINYAIFPRCSLYFRHASHARADPLYPNDPGIDGFSLVIAREPDGDSTPNKTP
jgi:hypothetical protein